MTIIFDFNRTIFDPETNALVPFAYEALQIFKTQGIEMHLVSKLEVGREDALESLGVAEFFTTKSFVEDKETAMRALVTDATGPVYVVGDYLHNEIRIGNQLGTKTVWLKRGRFSNLQPETEHDIPWRTIEDLKHLPKLLLD